MLACPSGGTCVPLIAPDSCTASCSFLGSCDKSCIHNNVSASQLLIYSTAPQQTATCVYVASVSTCNDNNKSTLPSTPVRHENAVERFPSSSSLFDYYYRGSSSADYGGTDYFDDQKQSHRYYRHHQISSSSACSSTNNDGNCITGSSSIADATSHSSLSSWQPHYNPLEYRQYISPAAHNYHAAKRNMSSVLPHHEQQHFLRPNFVPPATPAITSGGGPTYRLQQAGNVSHFGHHHQAPPYLGQTLVTTAITATPIITSHTVDGRRHSYNPYAAYSQQNSATSSYVNYSSSSAQHDYPSSRMYQPQQVFTASPKLHSSCNAMTILDLQQQRNAAPPSPWPPAHAVSSTNAPNPVGGSSAYCSLPPEYQQPYAFNNYAQQAKSVSAPYNTGYAPQQVQPWSSYREHQNNYPATSSSQHHQQQQAYPSGNYSASSISSSSAARPATGVPAAVSYGSIRTKQSENTTNNTTGHQFSAANFTVTAPAATFPPPNVSVLPPKPIHRQQQQVAVPLGSRALLQQKHQQVMYHPHPYHRYQHANNNASCQTQRQRAKSPPATAPATPASYRTNTVSSLGSSLMINGAMPQLDKLGVRSPIPNGDEGRLEAFQRFVRNTELMQRICSSDGHISPAACIEPIFEKDLQSLRYRSEQLGFHCQQLQKDSDAEVQKMQQTKADLVAKSEAFENAWQSITPAGLQENIDTKAAQYLLDFERQQVEEAAMSVTAKTASSTTTNVAHDFINGGLAVDDKRIVDAAEALLAMRRQSTMAADDRMNDSGIGNGSFQQS